MAKKFDYGLILIERLKASEGVYLDVRRIAKEQDLPAAYMEKVAQELKKAGWLESRRGLGGGYKLIHQEVSVADIITFFERPYNICPITRLKIRN